MDKKALAELAFRTDITIPSLVDCGDQSFVLRNKDESMMGPGSLSYPPDCLLLVDPDQREAVVSGDCVIARVKGQDALVFLQLKKQGDRRMLIPLNPRYPILTEEFSVIGKVLCGVIGIPLSPEESRR